MLMKTKIYGYPKKLYSAWEIVKLNTQRLRLLLCSPKDWLATLLQPLVTQEKCVFLDWLVIGCWVQFLTKSLLHQKRPCNYLGR